MDSAKFSSLKNVCLISKDEIIFLLNNPDFNYSWDEFYKKYQKAPGLLSFSMVGFNNDSTEVVVGTSYRQPKYRRDECYYLHYENNKWKIKWNEGIHFQEN